MLLRSWWRRYHFRAQLLTVAIAVLVISLVIAAWVPSALAGIAGAVVTAMLLGMQAQWRRRVDTANALPTVLELSSPRGGFPPVRDVSDAIAVGVHPAAMLERAGYVDRVPPYVSRDFEPDLHAALRRGGFTVLVGESAAGKTRAAFEAMRLLLGGFLFVSPSSRSGLPSLVPVLNELGDYVVWLDDLERFLGPDGLTSSVLYRLVAPPVRTVVLATMRSHEYDHYRDRLEVEMVGADRESWREGRMVLRQAQVIYVNRRWTPRETTRAKAHTSDHRLAQALACADRYGIAESLAAGPELAEAWRHAWAPGHHPRAAALVAAAVGARKAGYHRPLPQGVLDQMHQAYLAERGGLMLRPEPMQEALRWALVPTFPGGANGLLTGSPEEGYLAFDYLIDLPGSEYMPDTSWHALLDHAAAYDAYMIAELALRDGRHDRAVRGYRRAAETGIPLADAILSDLDAPVHPVPEALERAQLYFAEQLDELGTDHLRVLQAEQCIVVLNIYTGSYAKALTLARNLAVRAERSLGSHHRLVLALKWNVGWCTFRLGDIDEGLRKLEAAVAECSQIYGNRDMATATRRILILYLLNESGRKRLAADLLAKLKADYSDFPPDHTVAIELKNAINRMKGPPG